MVHTVPDNSGLPLALSGLLHRFRSLAHRLPAPMGYRSTGGGLRPCFLLPQYVEPSFGTKMKKIPRPDLKDAKRLTPMEMNNLHFKHPDKHSAIRPATTPVAVK